MAEDQRQERLEFSRKLEERVNCLIKCKYWAISDFGYNFQDNLVQLEANLKRQLQLIRTGSRPQTNEHISTQPNADGWVLIPSSKQWRFAVVDHLFYC